MSPRLLGLLASCCLLLVDFSSNVEALASAHGSNWSVDYNSTDGDEVAWTIRGDAGHQLRQLRVASAADVVVKFDSSLQGGDGFVVAKVVAVTDVGDRDIFDDDSDRMGLHVGTNPGGALELFVDDGQRYPLDKVWVHVARKGDLQSVTAHGSGSVTIHDDVLGSDKGVTLVATGSGDVVVKIDDPLSLQSLELISYDSGDVKLESKAAIAVQESVALAAHASGEVEIQSTTLEASTINVVTHGSGDVHVSSHSRLIAKSVALEAAGSGDIIVASSHGQCESEKVSLMGSSDITSADVACQNVNVMSAGSGDVIVNAVDRLDMSVFSSGSVKYAGDRPAHVTYMSPSSRSRPAKPVVRIEQSRPPKEPRGVKIHGGDVDVRSHHSHIHIENDGGDDSDSVQIWDDDDDDDADEGRFGFLSLAKTSGPSKTLAGVGIVAVAVVGVGVVAVVVARRRMVGYETIPLTI